MIRRFPKRFKLPPLKLKRRQIELNKILVPIDFSEHSKSALEYAIPFARYFGAKIDLIYVVEPLVYPADFGIGQIGLPNVETELQKRGKEQLNKLVREKKAEKIVDRKIVCIGKPFQEINQYATDNSVDLIIIATHGHSGVEHIIFGSTAEKVIRKAPCPVLVVKTGERGLINKSKC